jgi:hypothetical protein
MRSICHSETDIHLIIYGDYILDVNKGTYYVVYDICGLIDSAGSTKKLVTVCSFFFVLAFFKQT